MPTAITRGDVRKLIATDHAIVARSSPAPSTTGPTWPAPSTYRTKTGTRPWS